MAKQTRPRLEAVGWLFWSIAFAVLLGPSIYGAWQVVMDDQEWPIPVGMGVLLAGFLAAIVAWIVNSILYMRNKRLHVEAKRKSKKH